MSTQPLSIGLGIAERLGQSTQRFANFQAVIEQSLRVALPGIVQTFDPGPPAVVEVMIALNEYVFWNPAGPSSDNPILQTQSVRLPLLIHVPVCIPSAGGWSVTFPIAEGDECLVVFSDLAIDSWLQNGGIDNTPVMVRRHDLSDGIAIFGLRSMPKGLSGYSTSEMQIRNDAASTVISLGSGITVTTTGDVSVTASKVTVTASDKVSVTGANSVDINGSGHTTIEGRDFLNHVHKFVKAGPDLSGVVL